MSTVVYLAVVELRQRSDPADAHESRIDVEQLAQETAYPRIVGLNFRGHDHGHVVVFSNAGDVAASALPSAASTSSRLMRLPETFTKRFIRPVR